MTLRDDIAGTARRYLRDFGTFFEIDFTTVNATTLRMPQPLVSAPSVEIVNLHTSTVVPVTDYTVDERHGLIKLLLNPGTYPDGLHVHGIHYQWFLDEDLAFFGTVMIAEHSHNIPNYNPESIVGAEVEILSIGTLVQALWSLTTEFSTDIDVSTPEGISIPAHQRFSQVYQLMSFWQAQYDSKAAMLNLGLNRLEVFTLRRISRLTNRYPPMYRGREIDDPGPPVRVRPPIDIIAPTEYEEEEQYWQRAYQDSSEVFDLDGGWSSIGSSGMGP